MCRHVDSLLQELEDDKKRILIKSKCASVLTMSDEVREKCKKFFCVLRLLVDAVVVAVIV